MKIKNIHRWMILAAALCILAPPLLHGIDKPPLELSPEDRAILEKGEMVFQIEDIEDEQGNVTHRLRTYRIIAVPPEEVWKVLCRPEKDREWIPGVDVHYEVTVLFMTFEFNIHRVFHPDNLFIKNDLIESMDNDLAVSDSCYALYPCDDGQKTIMNYTLRLAVRQNIPKVVEDWFAKQSTKSWVENLKKRAESKGTWKK